MIMYTLLFAVIFFCTFLPYITEGKNLIGKGDGQSQYILQLRYMGEWLRSSLSGFLSGDFHPDRFDFTIGMGDDIGAVVRFHPLDFLSVFVPGRYTEALYCAITILRSYLAGLGLSAYLFHFKRDHLAVLSGALVYVFCGYTFGLGIVHPTYLSHMILFPLTLLGAEYMMDPERKHGPFLFIFSIALGFISNYYFMYISSFGILAYVLIRFFAIYKKERGRNFLRLLFSMLAAYMIGLLVSAVFLLPALFRYSTSLRADHSTERSSLLFYADKRRYLAWFLNCITPLEASGNGTHLNYSITFFPAAVITFASLSRREALRQLRKGLLLLLAALLVPGIGYVLAAMNNENNRWVYLIAFAAAVSVAFTADMALSMTRRERRLLLLSVCVFDVGCIVWYVMSKDAIYHAAAAFQLTLYSAVLLAKSRRAEVSASVIRTSEGKRRPFNSQKTVLLFTAASVTIGGFLTFSPSFGNLVTYYQERGTAFSRYETSAYSVYQAAGEKAEDGTGPFENGFYRVDGVRRRFWEDNSSLLLKQPGVQMYNSIINANELRMMIEGENIGLTSILHIQSLDGRTIPEELAGVKYFAVDQDNRASLPYGYSNTVLAEQKGFSLYENEHPLSFGYTVDTVIGSKDYEALSAPARDLAQLSAALVEEPGRKEKSSDESSADLLSGLKATDGQEFEKQILSVDADCAADENVTVGGNGERFLAGRKKGSLSVSFERKPGYECYLSLEGTQLLSGKALGGELEVICPGIDKFILLSASDNSYSRVDDDYLVNLGYTEEGSPETEDSLQILIPAYMRIRLSKARILYLPLQSYEEKIKMLNQSALENVVFDGDRVSGSLTLDEPRFLVLQIPCGNGWTAQVNGQTVPLYKTNLCYMGLWLDKGTSDVVLTYRSPGVLAGGMASLAGLLIILVLWYTRKIMKR